MSMYRCDVVRNPAGINIAVQIGSSRETRQCADGDLDGGEGWSCEGF